MDNFLLGSHVAQQSRRERLRFHPPEPTMVELNEVGLSNPYYDDPSGPLLDFGPPHNTLVGYDDVLDVGGSNMAFLSGYNNKYCYGSQGLSLSLSTSVVPFGSDGVVGEVHEPSVCYPESYTQCLPSSGDVDNRFVGGPLGPFTGYAAILKSSRFLEPAQQLLDEMFGAVSSVPCVGRSGGSSSSSVQGSSWGAAEAVGGCYGREFSHHKMQQKKSMLLVMQGEVWKKYKQFHQQMKMAMSSFESVAGLNAAIPFSSLALKNVSKHFRFLRKVISEQLLNISKVLGEELALSPAANKTEVVATPVLKFMDETLKKQSEDGNGLGFVGNNRPAWRPQRGLPERAVAVLRAWLFDHFLHPYPTDTDKLMLATQTGLSRNQVSNWFINARVRVWKPLVEEIHKLENNMVTNLNSSKNEATSGGEIAIHNEARQIAAPSHHVKHTDCCESDWQVDRRPRMEHCSIVEGFDGGIDGYSPYHGGFNMAELGGVSLTLGLRQEEGSQQQLRPYYGSNLVQEFVG